MLEMQLRVERSALLRSAQGTHFPSMCSICSWPLPCSQKGTSAGLREIQFGLTAGSMIMTGRQGICLNLWKGKGSGQWGGVEVTEVSPGFGLGGAKVPVSSFLHMEKNPENQAYWFLLPALNSFLLPAVPVVFGVKKGNMLLFTPLDWSFPTDDNRTVAGYDFIHSFIHTK